MKTPTNDRAAIDAYIAQHPPKVRAILKKIRATVRAAAPHATERLSYRMPAFFAPKVLVYFAAFQHHIGIYPPVRGNAGLTRALAPYRGEKGNLRFPLDEPIPYALITRIVKQRLRTMKKGLGR